jgi:AAA+ superfamily predicted ATPase
LSQYDYIKDIAKFGLNNDQQNLLNVLNELIEHSKKSRKLNFALQLQSILKESIRNQKTSSLVKVDSDSYYNKQEDREFNDLILEKITSDYEFENLICDQKTRKELEIFIKEHSQINLLHQYQLPVSNKILLHGPSGCGKTLASYIIASELNKMMFVINLGAVVSSKLGETSKNLSKVFKRAASEDVVIFLDEFDSLGKLRDYNQDHGEMKRVVNTILQLFDYLPQKTVVIAATNQAEMLDEALVRRFDVNIKFKLPTQIQIKELIKLTLKNGNFKFDRPATINSIIKTCHGLSYYSVQKTLINAIKRSLFESIESKNLPTALISTRIWTDLIKEEKRALTV